MTIKKHKLPFALLNQTWYLRGISNDLELGLLQRIRFATLVQDLGAMLGGIFIIS